MSFRIRLRAALLITTLAVAGGAATADAHSSAAKAKAAGEGRQPSKTTLRLKGLRDGDLTVGKDFTAAGTLAPYVKGQKVTVLLHRGKHTVERKTLKVQPKGKGSKLGKFSFSDKLIKPGRYSVEAFHDKNATLGGSKDETRRFHIRYPDLRQGNAGDAVKIFNKLLGNLGYVNDENHTYNEATSRAVLAYRKVNNMDRKYSASVTIFKKLAKGSGGYRLKHPGAGKHVEADISRQVMVLAEGGKVDEIYTISSGKSTTPTILGEFHFYRKDPGYNSEGMYYSSYFEGGYATHGYASVPDYPASHGCLRNPIPDSVHIYNWIDIGDPIFIYH